VTSHAAFIALASIAITLAGCKFKPDHDMEEQPSAHPAYKPSEAFPDGTTARPVPYGTVPRAAADSPGFPYAEVRELLPAMTGSAAETDVVPFPITREVLLRGQERYRIYCSVCHGRLGDGNGMIVQRGFRAPPSYHTERLRKAPLGYFFDVMTNGFGAMPEYASQIPPRDRWTIVAYIRALQLSQDATVSEVPAGQKVPSEAPVFRGDPGSGATLPELQPGAAKGGAQ
jgi:mono/diheme cytochrome c family protein